MPLWVKLACAIAIAAGTSIGGWRIINTMGNRLTEIESPRGSPPKPASAAVILSSSFYGYPLSTTHVVSGGVLGAGAGKKLESVHWGVAGQMATAWLFTIPAAGALGAATWEVARIFGANSTAGTVVMGSSPPPQRPHCSPSRSATRSPPTTWTVLTSHPNTRPSTGPRRPPRPKWPKELNMLALADPIVDTSALWKIIAASLAGARAAPSPSASC